MKEADVRPSHRTGIGRLFALASLIEALTWAGLLVGMYFKYIAGTTDFGVWLFGRLHGAAFLFYLVVTMLAARRLRWPWWGTALALLAALPPLVTVPLEMWFERRGFLTDAGAILAPGPDYRQSTTTL
jgi:integral membrane protein